MKIGMKIQPNIGNVDRIIRGVLGIALILVAFLLLDAADAEIGGIVLAVFGVLLIVTAATRYCVGYTLFHYSTFKNK